LIYERAEEDAQPAVDTLQKEDDWRCYRMYSAKGIAVDHPPVSETAAKSLRQEASRTVEVNFPQPAWLEIGSELGRSCTRAVRQRLEPLLPECYKPFDWITLLPEPRTENCGDSPCSDTGAALVINATSWEYLRRKLPIARAGTGVVDSTVAFDNVRVSIGDFPCQEEQRACSVPTEHWWTGQWQIGWQYVLTHVAAALLAAGIATLITLKAVQRHMEPVTYTLVETDLGNPLSSKAVGVSSKTLYRWS